MPEKVFSGDDCLRWATKGFNQGAMLAFVLVNTLWVANLFIFGVF